jgi:hypothetical protein
MVEVIDLANGCHLMLNDEEIVLSPELAFATLIHNMDLIPDKFKSLPFQRLPEFNDKPVFLYRFPYKVFQKTIENVIDLRYPFVQEWFFDTFRIPSEETDACLLDDYPDPTIAYSRFHLGNIRAPVPETFWKMLPTLMNPDLGGGNPGTTGSTVLWIGHWMRQNQVGAFIYPSARCDVTVLFQNGELEQFYGWNLVDFEDTAPYEGRVRFITFEHSPWAWVDFEDGVKLHLAPAGEMAGSFKVDGMVNYWAKDYLGQIAALETARRIHGPAICHDGAAKGFRAGGFWIGVLCLRWLRFINSQEPQDLIEELILELHGLALSFGIYGCSGRIGELWNSVKAKPMEFRSILEESVGVADRAGNSMQLKYSDPSLCHLVQLGNDLEFLLLIASAVSKNGKRSGSSGAPKLADKYAPQLVSWFDEKTAVLLQMFLAEAPRRIEEGGSGTHELLSEGEFLIEAAYRSLRS